MDLLATVRKEGSRGGRTDFKWSDVQNSSHREHYLGHSINAPVGRWAKNRDLNWYAKANIDENDGENPAARAARNRKEEIQRVKEAEEDALARALGLPVPQRNNANLEPVSDKREVDKMLKESSNLDSDGGKGIGYGASASKDGRPAVSETIEDAGIVTTLDLVEAAAAAEILSDATTDLIVIITEDDIVTSQARDIERAKGTVVVENVLGHVVPAIIERRGIEIVPVLALPNDHEEMTINDVDTVRFRKCLD